MASKHTEKYLLNQWEGADQVVRTDFNEDNLRIEAAILGRLGAVEVIQEQTLEGAEGAILLNVTGLDWSEWSMVAAVCRCSGSYPSEVVSSFSITGATVSGHVNGALCKRSPGPMLALLFPRRSGENQVQCLAFPGGEFVVGSDRFDSISNLRFSMTGPYHYAAGTQAALYGIR